MKYGLRGLSMKAMKCSWRWHVTDIICSQYSYCLLVTWKTQRQSGDWKTFHPYPVYPTLLLNPLAPRARSCASWSTWRWAPGASWKAFSARPPGWSSRSRQEVREPQWSSHPRRCPPSPGRPGPGRGCSTAPGRGDHVPGARAVPHPHLLHLCGYFLTLTSFAFTR